MNEVDSGGGPTSSPQTPSRIDQAAPQRIPLNTLAIGLGSLGFAASWSALGEAYGWVWWSAEPLWAAGALLMVALVVAQIAIRSLTDSHIRSVRQQLRAEDEQLQSALQSVEDQVAPPNTARPADHQ
ncbi:hypothetical protein [Lacisediminihabitans changchengi]|uniref:Uncharacterized protein n=1 Tax=Lacisediminihabitans changchengi TaxID=2787634 RepID=A0A934SNY3_9MICO|nr:hypothetical protein [Lacisediminihabitans changchengi]MBK4348789.1 hypothetical protein [Lacisediminihabitans changchengi]